MSKASRLGEGERRRAAGKKREVARRKDQRDGSGSTGHLNDDRRGCRDRWNIGHAVAVRHLDEHTVMAGIVCLTMMKVFVKKGRCGHGIDAEENQKQQRRNEPLLKR